ncbi:MAG: Uma2 family endonuclease [Armatimonadetes bacterium]|nr:Uma2 family endonuclease [Armatimonadota bacterium]MDW8028001.1 Uma2 family endonuclease [Armatimonadota bacterium]
MASKTSLIQPKQKRWTIEDWLNLPEGPPYYELEDGRLIEMPSPRAIHQEIVGVLYFVLRQFVMERNLGLVVMAVDVALPTGKGYIPDLVFVGREKADKLLAPDGKIHGTPDLVVEVVSPTTKTRDRIQKMKGYFEAGVEWVWLIDSDDLTVEEFKRKPEGYLLVSTTVTGEVFEPKAFSGLKLNLAQLLGKTQESSKGKVKRRG